MASFAPEVIFHLGSFPITNTFLNTLLVDSFILTGIVFLNKHLSIIPNMFQNIMEIVLETFRDFITSVADTHTDTIFPFVVSFFIFILLANWSGLIPGINSIGFHPGTTNFVPLIKNATSDLNATFALALISLIATHALSIRTIGLREYLSRYFSLNPINLFVGLLEIVSEITKVISLSFRLFGNIYAGEVVLTTISKLFAFVFPIPFMLLEVVVGFVQALVFALLTMVFMTLLMTPHHETAHAAKGVSEE